MPGIDKSRFTSIIEDDWCCGICLSVFVKPMVTQCCQQTYCSECIHQWITTSKTCPNDRKALTNKKLSHPPRILINLLNKQLLKCDFFEDGCLEEISYGRYKQHLKECRFNPETICGNCEQKTGNRNEHNCVQILAEKYKCLQSLQKKIEDLENDKKTLIDTKTNLENDLLNQKNKYDEMKRENNRLKASKEVLNEKCKKWQQINKSNNEIIEKLLNNEIIKMSGMMSKFRQKINKLKMSLKLKNLPDLKAEILSLEKILDSVANKQFNETFQLRIDITKLSLIKLIVGPVITVNGLQWHLRARYVVENNTEYLGFYLVCNSVSKSEMWSCIAYVEMSIVSQTDEAIINDHKYTQKYFNVFDWEKNNCGFKNFMKLSEILDPKNDYLSDDSKLILLKACISL